MKSIFYKTEIIETYKDHPNKYSLVIFTVKCNFKCFHCHNYKELNESFPETYKLEELIEKIKELEEIGIYDLLIICGGEPTIHGKRLIEQVKEIRKNIKLPIRLDTNGSNPKVIKELIDKKLIDGVAMDIKFPYWNFFKKEKEDKIRYEKIIGIKFTKTLQKNLMESIDLIVKNLNNEFSLFRTVKYPILKENEILEIKEFLNKKGWKGCYQTNEFYYINNQ